MFGWFKKAVEEKLETPYQILVARGKQYLDLSQEAMKQAKYATSISCHYAAKSDLEAAKVHEIEAVRIFTEAHKLLRSDEPEDESVKNFIEAETYR